MYVPTQIEILQSPGYVLILFERAHTYRIIPTDAPPARRARAIGLWQGDSRGRWEGNTLVVDVTNQNGKAWFDQAGNFYSSAAHMVERFTPDRRGHDPLPGDHRRSDASTPGRGRWRFRCGGTRSQGFRLLEEACHEGERNTDPLIRAGQQNLSRHQVTQAQERERRRRSRLTADRNRAASSFADSHSRQRMANGIAFSRASGISPSHSAQRP